jgi:hypothetical protein
MKDEFKGLCNRVRNRLQSAGLVSRREILVALNTDGLASRKGNKGRRIRGLGRAGLSEVKAWLQTNQ